MKKEPAAGIAKAAISGSTHHPIPSAKARSASLLPIGSFCRAASSSRNRRSTARLPRRRIELYAPSDWRPRRTKKTGPTARYIPAISPAVRPNARVAARQRTRTVAIVSAAIMTRNVMTLSGSTRKEIASRSGSSVPPYATPS